MPRLYLLSPHLELSSSCVILCHLAGAENNPKSDRAGDGAGVLKRVASFTSANIWMNDNQTEMKLCSWRKHHFVTAWHSYKELIILPFTNQLKTFQPSTIQNMSLLEDLVIDKSASANKTSPSMGLPELLLLFLLSWSTCWDLRAAYTHSNLKDAAFQCLNQICFRIEKHRRSSEPSNQEKRSLKFLNLHLSLCCTLHTSVLLACRPLIDLQVLQNIRWNAGPLTCRFQQIIQPQLYFGKGSNTSRRPEPVHTNQHSVFCPAWTSVAFLPTLPSALIQCSALLIK